MGLEEKRAMKTATDEDLPKFKAAYKSLIGTDVQVDIDWASFEGNPWNGAKSLTTYGFTPILDAAKKIAKDDMGKSAMAEGLKKVVIRNTNKTADRKVSSASGELTLSEFFGAGEYFTSNIFEKEIVKIL